MKPALCLLDSVEIQPAMRLGKSTKNPKCRRRNCAQLNRWLNDRLDLLIRELIKSLLCQRPRPKSAVNCKVMAIVELLGWKLSHVVFCNIT